MGFCGYKYKFGLYAAHSNIMNHMEDVHYHNFTITLYINAANGKPDENYGVERAVKDWLTPYQGQHLARTDLFAGRETTVEGMGNTFFEPLYDLIRSLGYELVRLEIYENPIRVYTVSQKRLDSSVNEIGCIPKECIPIILFDDNQESRDMKISSEVIQDKTDSEQISDERKKQSDENPDVDNKDKADHENEQPEQEATAAVEIVNDTAWQENTDAAAVQEYTDDTAAVQENTDNAAGSSYTIYKENKFLVSVELLVGLICLIALASVTMYVVKTSGRYPQGWDTFCHLYRADLILKSIKQGNWFPLYDPAWYNGVEIMRYWGPVPLYIIAGLEWLFHCSALNAYILFLGTLIIIGGCGWLLWGISCKRVALSVIIGMVWFYMPENMRVIIFEGNLPRGVINALLPFYFYFLWKVMADKKKNFLWPLMIVTTLITLCHLGITLMLIATVAIFTMIYSKMNHSFKSSLYALGASISGVLTAGIWAVPALIGGAASGSATNQVMKKYFENAVVSLNPFTRLSGDIYSFYFGFSVFLLCMLGIFFGTRKVKPGFITALILYLFTTKSVYTIFSKLPFSQFLWMIRFIPIALAAAMVSFLLWKQLKKWMVLLLSVLMIADCVTSYQYIYFPKEDRVQNVQESLDARAGSLLITQAKEITNQRMAVLDLSIYGSFAPYYIAGVGKRVNYTFGAGWEGAGTAANIVNLNTAAENGWYVYLFDRALELGNDTVLLPIQNLKEKSKDVDIAIASANISGYNLVNNDGNSLLFHKETKKQFGTVTDYKNIAIGASSSGIAMIFPSFEEGSRNNINDYTYKELSKYRNIFLSGFTYKEKSKAEELLLKLSENGVNIFIDMNNAPVDKVKKRIELFGVNSQSITFTEAYPELKYRDEFYKSLDFSADISKWNTVYLDGLSDAEGYCNMEGNSFPFFGTAKNKNLHFIGMNLVYYLQTTRDSEIMKLVKDIFEIDEKMIPDRKVVPVSIKTDKNRITINSAYDNVNTALSGIDIFSSTRNYKVKNNLITVDSGVTVIDIGYPHLIKGILVTGIGAGLSILIYVSMLRMKVNEENEGTEDKKTGKKGNSAV